MLLAPKKPKPPKVNNDLLSSWGLGGNNANSIIRVLKHLGLVGEISNETTSDYEAFMHPQTGPARLAEMIRSVYCSLFDAAHHPHTESDEILKRYFNIHSGGGERVIQYQIQTFKALCDHADFSTSSGGDGANGRPDGGSYEGNTQGGVLNRSGDGGPPSI
jgi:hypothetical protein